MSNTKGIRGVIWDLDGTLLNTLEDLAAAVNHGLTTHGMPVRTLDEVRQFVGNGVANLIAQAVPTGTPADTTAAVLATFREYYALHSLDTTAPYPGISDGLAALKARDVPMAVVSNKLESAVEVLRQRFFADSIQLAVGDLPNRPKKPAPDGTLVALQALGLTPEEALFVGDSEVDVATARNAGLRCLTVTWGFRDEDTLRQAGADTFAASPEEAFAAIRRLLAAD